MSPTFTAPEPMRNLEFPKATSAPEGIALDPGSITVGVAAAGTATPVARFPLTLTAGLGGSISAEHGVGVAKAGWISLCRSAADIAAMTGIKRAFDPAGILNPGVILPAA